MTPGSDAEWAFKRRIEDYGVEVAVRDLIATNAAQQRELHEIDEAAASYEYRAKDALECALVCEDTKAVLTELIDALSDISGEACLAEKLKKRVLP